MPARFVGVVGFVLISLGCASQVSADYVPGFFNSIARDVKRRQCWPDPFAAPDRAAVRTALRHDGRQRLAAAEHARRVPLRARHRAIDRGRRG